MAWGSGGWGSGPWSTEICEVVEAASVTDRSSAVPEYPAVVVETARVNDFSAEAMQEFLAAVIEQASARDFTIAVGIVNIDTVERAAALDLPSTTQDFAVLCIDGASGIEIITAGGVINFVVVEQAAVTDGGAIQAMQEYAATILELVTLHEELIGLPVFLCQIIDTAGAQDMPDATGVYLIGVGEAASGAETIQIGGTYSFTVVENALAQDVPAAPINTTIAVSETAGAHDAGSALTDLWVPVDDGGSNIWVPVNDNPTSPWLPVIP